MNSHFLLKANIPSNDTEFSLLVKKLDKIVRQVAKGVNVNIRMYNFDDVQCTVIPSVAYGFVTGMNLQLC